MGKKKKDKQRKDKKRKAENRKKRKKQDDATVKNGKPLYYVAESAIHGHGLFARKKIKRDTLIGHFEGRSVDEDGTHVLWIEDDDGSWTGTLVENEIRFANHSKEPNAGVFNGDELWSMRKIRKGEEITFDYGDDWD